MNEQVIHDIEVAALKMVLEQKSKDDIIRFVESRADLTSDETDEVFECLNIQE